MRLRRHAMGQQQKVAPKQLFCGEQAVVLAPNVEFILLGERL
jgi:hypothetical protein